MKRVIFLVGIISLPLVLAACQTLSKEECVAADWRVIGEQDGAAGRDPQARFGDHAKSCEKAGIVADQGLWNEGYQRGLIRFCTPLNGLSHGQLGKSYANSCPTNLDPGFRSGYSLGMKKHKKLKEMTAVKNKIHTKQAAIRANNNLVQQGKIDQQDAQRMNLENQSDINQLNRELGRKDVEIAQINNEIMAFQGAHQIAQ